jgi:hypothetical protein
MELGAGAVFLASGLYMLYIARKFSGYIGKLPDKRGNRKIRRNQIIIFVMGVSLLVAAAWNFGLFFNSGGL